MRRHKEEAYMLTTKWKKQNWKDYKLHDYNYDVLKRGNYIDKKMSVLAGDSKEGRQGGMGGPQVREDRRGQGTTIKRMRAVLRYDKYWLELTRPRRRKILLPVHLEPHYTPLLYTHRLHDSSDADHKTSKCREWLISRNPHPLPKTVRIFFPLFPTEINCLTVRGHSCLLRHSHCAYGICI